MGGRELDSGEARPRRGSEGATPGHAGGPPHTSGSRRPGGPCTGGLGTLTGLREPPWSAGGETKPMVLSGPRGCPGRQPLGLGPPFVSASPL